MSGGWPGQRQRPSTWKTTRATILDRDAWACQVLVAGALGGRVVCGAPAREVDHVDPMGGSHEANLRAICRTHHGEKTAAEGNAARWRYPERRPPETHPGLRSH